MGRYFGYFFEPTFLFRVLKTLKALEESISKEASFAGL